MELKVGDRVRYISEDYDETKGFGWYPPKGTMGTVRTISNPYPDGQVLVEVAWDYGVKSADRTWWCYTTDVENAEDEEIVRHIQLPREYKIKCVDKDESVVYQMTHNFRMAVTKSFDEMFIKACIDYAESEGITDLYLINGEFVKTAIENEIKRRKGSD